MSDEMMPDEIRSLDWDKGDGLLPAIVQDAGNLRVRRARADRERRSCDRDRGQEGLEIGHQNCPPTLKVMSLVSSPF